MKIVGQKKCSSSRKIYAEENFIESYVLNDNVICATSPSDHLLGATCFEDSGGLLVINNKLAGTLSFWVNCTNI